MKKQIIVSAIIAGILFTTTLQMAIPATAIELIRVTPSKSQSSVVNPSKDDMVIVDFGLNLNNKLKETISILDNINFTGNTSRLDEVLKNFISFHDNLTEEVKEKHEANDQFNYIFYEMVWLAYSKIQNPEDRNQFILKLSDGMYGTIARNGNGLKPSFYFDYYPYLLTIAEKDIPEIYKQIMYAYSLIFTGSSSSDGYGGNDGTNGNFFDENLKPSEINPVDQPPPTHNKVDPSIPDISDFIPKPKEPAPYIPEKENSTTFYVREGNKCIEETKKYDLNGKLIKVDRKNADKSKYRYCGIFDYENNFNRKNVKKVRSTWNADLKTDEQLSPYTIHFTVNKKDKNPYIYDTGIRVTEKKEATYEQIKMMLILLTSKSNGFYVEDIDKILAVVEGKTFVLNKTNSFYNQKFIEEIFKDSENIAIKIIEPVEKQQEEPSDNLITEIKGITINGKNLKLKNQPLIRSQRLMLPVIELSKNLGADIETKDSIVISKDNTRIICEVGKNTLSINGNDIPLGTYIEEINGVIYSEVQSLIESLGYDTQLDTEKGILNIIKK